MAERFLQPVGFAASGALAGILHDMGKATSAFQLYLQNAVEHPDRKPADSPHHAPTGAVFAYERWYNGNPIRKLVAQIVSMAICGHHAGLPDCLDEKGHSPFPRPLRPAGEGKTSL